MHALLRLGFENKKKERAFARGAFGENETAVASPQQPQTTATTTAATATKNTDSSENVGQHLFFNS
jgi:hypothetical protein